MSREMPQILWGSCKPLRRRHQARDRHMTVMVSAGRFLHWSSPTANTKLGSPYLVGDDSPNPKHSISRKPWARDPKIDGGSGFRADSRFDVGSCITVDLYQRASLTYELSDFSAPKFIGSGYWTSFEDMVHHHATIAVMSISYQPLSSDSKSDTSDRLSFILQSIIPGIFISGIRDLKPAVLRHVPGWWMALSEKMEGDTD